MNQWVSRFKFLGWGFTYDDRDVQDHIGNIGGFRRPF